MVKAILFDFGGVLAEEGFRNGLTQIAMQNGLDPDRFYADADAIIYETGYLTGDADESVFWEKIREKTGILGTDEELREEILERFILRPEMLACAETLRSRGFMIVMLSDQTNWLEEIAIRTPLFRHFDRIFNSMRLHRSKRDATTFPMICDILGLKPAEALFIDDNKGHIDRAAGAGLLTIHFTTPDKFNEQLRVVTGTACGS